MDAIETAIRNALAKGDASDRAFREKVYRSIFSALNKATSENSNVTTEMAVKRRQALAQKVREVEAAYIRAEHHIAEPDKPEVQAPDRDEAPNGTGASDHALEPELDIPVESNRKSEPELQVENGTDAPPVFSTKRRPYAWVLIAAIVAAAIGIGAWWAFQTGLIFADTDTIRAVPSDTVDDDSESYRPDDGDPPALTEERTIPRNWITIFDPSDPASLVAATGATAEVTDTSEGQKLRIQSSKEDAAVMFDVGQGVLEQIAGEKAVFAIVAVAEEGKPSEMSVRCNFGNLGDCVRRRFNIGVTEADFIIEVDLPDQQPGAAGTIAIVSDVSGQGKAILVKEVKVSISR